MIRINLLKPETKEIREGPAIPLAEPKAKKRLPLTNFIIFAIIVVLAAIFFLQKKTIDQERTRLQTAQEEKNKLQYVIAKLDQLKQQKASFEKKINLISLLKMKQGIAVSILDQLSKDLPDWVWLTEVSFEGKLVQIKGNALSNNLIADYIFNLQNSPFFHNVNLISSTQRSAGGIDQYLEFSLTAEYAMPEAQPPQGTPTQATLK